jgi:hypothetical protein
MAANEQKSFGAALFPWRYGVVVTYQKRRGSRRLFRNLKLITVVSGYKKNSPKIPNLKMITVVAGC